MPNSADNSHPVDIAAFMEKDFIYQQYQPIVELSTHQIYGYEALSRCKIRMNPFDLFHIAAQQKLLNELDMFCMTKGIRSYFSPDNPKERLTLFVNVYPSTILHPSFVFFVEQLAEQLQGSSAGLVFEINEALEEKEKWESKNFKRILSKIRKYGFRIAMDDVGDGAASLKRIVDFSPDIIKLSRYFSSDLSANRRKQRVVKLLLDYCGDAIMLILEGIETSDDLECARDAGVELGQGFYLGRPQGLINRVLV